MMTKNHLDIRQLISFSLKSLKEMQIENFLFCYQRGKRYESMAGESIRYSLISLIGLLTAQSFGYPVEIDINRTISAVMDRMGQHELGPGDLGLYLWLDALVDGKRRKHLLHQLLVKLERSGGLDRIEGQELSWIILGLVQSTKGSREHKISELLRESITQITENNLAPNGLFYHYGKNILRRNYPNFATQIYSIYALSKVYSAGLNDEVINIARKAVETLSNFQLPDFGWPWIYDVKNNCVVEPYEVYSVHQDAMAPMALLDLYEATNKMEYKEMAINSLLWIYGNNQLDSDMVDLDNGIVYRSIRRKKPLDKIFLYASYLSTKMFSRNMLYSADCRVEVNKTCRPYHFGWLLQAWSGRENL